MAQLSRTQPDKNQLKEEKLRIASNGDPTSMDIFSESEAKGAAMVKVLKQVCSRNKAMEKQELWKAREVEDKGSATTISLKSNKGEVVSKVTRVPKGANVTKSNVNKFEEERLKNAERKEDISLNRFCDGKDNAWRPDSFFTETCGGTAGGDDIPPWPVRPQEIFTNPQLCLRIMNHQMQKKQQKKDEKKRLKEEKALQNPDDKKPKKSKKDKKKKKKDKKKKKKDKKDKKVRKEKKTAKRKLGAAWSQLDDSSDSSEEVPRGANAKGATAKPSESKASGPDAGSDSGVGTPPPAQVVDANSPAGNDSSSSSEEEADWGSGGSD